MINPWARPDCAYLAERNILSTESLNPLILSLVTHVIQRKQSSCRRVQRGAKEEEKAILPTAAVLVEEGFHR